MSTMAPERYPKPPITEAVIAFNFEQPLDEAGLARFRKVLERRFPNHREVLRGQITLNPQRADVPEAALEKSHRLANDDENRIAILSPKSISISHLAPYESWDVLRKDALELWRISRKIGGVRKLTRYGVRYINRIDLKVDEKGNVDPTEFFNLCIHFPETFDAEVLGYELRFKFNYEDIKSTATVSSKAAEPVIMDHGAFYLDIDISSTYELPQKEDVIFALLDTVRERKNALFESFITDQARALFYGT